MSVFSEVELGLQILGQIQAALPALAQAATDFKQAYTDKSDLTKAAADLNAAITVLEPLINQVIALLPTPAPAPAPAIPPAA